MNDRKPFRTNVSEHVVDLVDALPVSRVRTVDYMQQQPRIAGFLEGGFESGDKFVGQVANEPNGIGQDDLSAIGNRKATQRRIQRSEQLIDSLDAGSAKLVEQRRLAGIRVADQ